MWLVENNLLVSIYNTPLNEINCNFIIVLKDIDLIGILDEFLLSQGVNLFDSKSNPLIFYITNSSLTTLKRELVKFMYLINNGVNVDYYLQLI